MDTTTFGAIFGTLSNMPNNAASSAAQAAESAQLAQEYADALDMATVAETLAYMDIEGSTAPADEVTVSGRNPVLKAAKNTYYVCGELQTLSFTPSAKGICAVRFTSGTTATIMTVPSSLKWPDWFSGTLEANRTYEISVLDGVYGAVMSWA